MGDGIYKQTRRTARKAGTISIYINALRLLLGSSNLIVVKKCGGSFQISGWWRGRTVKNGHALLVEQEGSKKKEVRAIFKEPNSSFSRATGLLSLLTSLPTSPCFLLPICSLFLLFAGIPTQKFGASLD